MIDRPLTSLLLAVDQDDARAWLKRNPQPGRVHVATVRSSAAARGVTVDRILETPRLDRHTRADDLRAAAAPCLAAGGREIGDLEFERVHAVRVHHAPRFARFAEHVLDDPTSCARLDGHTITIDALERTIVYRVIDRGPASYLAEKVHDTAAAGR